MQETASLREQARHRMQQGQWGEAIGLWQAVLQAQPRDAASALALSTCLQQLQLLDEAVVMAKNALAAAEAAENDAGSAHAAGPGAIRPAGELRAQARLQLAHLYAAQKREADAGMAYSALLGQPGVDVPAAIGLSQVWLREGYPTRALAALAPLAARAADHPELAQALALAHFEAGDAPSALAALLPSAPLAAQSAQSAQAAPVPAPGTLPSAAAMSNALMFASYVPEQREIEERLRPWVAQVWPATGSAQARPAPGAAGADARSAAPSSPAQAPQARLRVGWVSADFYAHPVGYFLAGFLPHLREHGVDSILYANGRRQDAWTDRLAQAAQAVVAIDGLSTEAACARIAQDGLDILIDLSGHTQGHRLDVFARRACRVQASYLGYFSSTLVPAMDGLITDRSHVPPEDDERYSERLVYLPHSRFCFAPPPEAPAPAEPPGLRNGYITWGAFTNLAKISDACVAQWAQVLQATPGSRMQLRWKTLVDAGLRQSLRERFARHGIAPGRIELHGAMRHADMLAAYAEVDVVLDTFPFSGATTTCEALWMGVPVLTRVADRAAGRQTASILQTLGEPGWIAGSEAQLVEIARALAQDAQGLARTRAGLRQKMAATTLVDGRRFAAGMAQVLRDLAGGDPPA